MTRSGFGVAMLTSASLLLAATPSISQESKPDSNAGQLEQPMHGPKGDLPFAPPGDHQPSGHRHEPGFGPDFRAGPRFDPAMDLANDLAGVETYVGITASQIDAWRGYTSALIDFVDAHKPPMPADFDRDGDMSKPAPGKAVPLQAELLAERSMTEAESAKKLRDEVVTLIATLSPEQLERLANADRKLDLLGPPPPPFGPMDAPAFPNGG